MSTTVSYKGATIATVSNDTKTLLTEGKYLEDDLTLVDVSGGGAVLTTKNISANGTYNASSDSADGYSQVNVAVPASAVDTGTKSITANGSNQDVVGYAAVDVAVPNSYSAGDEGKVVSNGALVAQTAHADVTPTASDQTIDTTTNNSIKVKGDADLVAGNIKKDVEIFGVTGSYEGGGGNDDAILSGTLSGTYTNDTVTKLKFAIFRGVTTLEHISLPEATRFAGQAFYQCTGLETLSAIKCSTIDTDAVTNCTALTSVTLPKLYELVNNLFSGCSSLQIADIRGAIIRTGSFNNCASLQTIVIRNASVANLIGINAFNGTPFASGGAGGTIYVPSSLIDSYKSASNWSTVHGYGTITWAAIEGSYYETHYADGTLIPT